MNSLPIIKVDGVAQRFGRRTVFKDVTFDVAEGEVFNIIGGSGSGKTTLMKQMVGLLRPSAGRISICGYDAVTEVGAVRRKIGVMFQSGALFGSMTLIENVMLPLTIFTDLSTSARAEIARMKLALVGLADAAEQLPVQISGGMVKRAAIARAMALDPPILFLDEPAAGLDPISAAGLDRLVLDLRDTLGATFVVVSHELQSILAISDRCLMLDGRAQGTIALGKPKDLQTSSAIPMVRAFFNREAMPERDRQGISTIQRK